MGGRHSTPRMPSTATKTMRSKQPAEEMEEPSFAEYPSPYETLKRQVEGKSAQPKHSSHQPITPGKPSALPDMSMTPTSSPFEIDFDIAPPSTIGKNNKDTILHQGILNKTYRVAATPHTARKNKALGIGATPQTANRTRRILDFEDTMSSPLEEAPAPRLRAEFFSPVKGPRTPGVSVQTPGRKMFGKPSFEPVAAKDELTRGRSRAWSDDDDDDDDLLESPPKTIMFNLPESRVLQTPGMFLKFSQSLMVLILLQHKRRVEEWCKTSCTPLAETLQTIWTIARVLCSEIMRWMRHFEKLGQPILRLAIYEMEIFIDDRQREYTQYCMFFTWPQTKSSLQRTL